MIPNDTIKTAEILNLLGLESAALSKIRTARNSTMPKPINRNRKLLIYDRETMLAWIEKRLKAKADAYAYKHLATPPVTGFDNAMASAFLRKPGRGEFIRPSSRPLGE
jgi:hypothetical protein